MATCIRPDLTPSSAYKYYRCRCERCVAWKHNASKRTDDKIRAAERARLWRLNNPERSRENVKQYQINNPDKVLAMKLKPYGLTLDDYQSMLAKQNGVCAICKSTCTYKSRLSVDHNHQTGIVRGLLCGNCNTGLGKFKDNPEFLQAALRYLDENGDVY